MILAVMQPYFFPYLGYYQLAGSVDHFVFLDDVAFIRRGFIHRNSILLDGAPHRFTLPVSDLSQNRAINEHCFVGDYRTFLAKLHHAYAHAPHFRGVQDLVAQVCSRPERNVALKAADSVRAVFDYLDLPLSCSFASEQPPAGLGGQQRILALCRHFGAERYHNASGGRELYDATVFAEQGVELRFLQPHLRPYTQPGTGFVPGLSIIDVLMHNPVEVVRSMLADYDLSPASA
ncbi:MULTISPECIES: WbqC family protein [Pseudomonas]|uniref:WbqC family protein n=1 Tax=Pseudomonas TaxID=286 RepID=UPI000AEA167E|nr:MULTISPECIES: WbqC family protein [Pseudomonas]WAB89701.1 WbqC family protein [Pseudomonas citronellolis]